MKLIIKKSVIVEVGFEPTMDLTPQDLKPCAFNHSAILLI